MTDHKDTIITLKYTDLVRAMLKTLDTEFGPINRELKTKVDEDKASDRELAGSRFITFLRFIDEMALTREDLQ